MGLQTAGLTTDQTVEIISAYSATNQQISAVASEPGWYIVGAFQMPVNSDARLEAIGLLSEAGLTMNVRLYDVTDVAVVEGSTATITALVDTRVRGGIISLVGGHLYQIQAEVIGSSGFGVLQTADLLSA